MIVRRLALLGLAAPFVARAQDLRSGRLIVPYGPGGSSDVMGRILAAQAGNWVVENRGGGASIPGTQAVANAPGDGSVIGTADNALVVNAALLKERVPYQLGRDIVALGLAVTAPLLLLAHPSAPAQTLPAILAEARRTRGGLSLSHGGNGTPTHLAALQMQIASGQELNMISYRGGGPQLTGLVSGEVNYGFVAISAAFGHVEGGRLKPVAISGPTRNPQMPNVPTMTEAGLAGVDVVGWWGFIAPGSTPPALLERLNDHMVQPARGGESRERLEGLGYTVVASRPAAFAERIRREVPEWSAIFEKAGIKPD